MYLNSYLFVCARQAALGFERQSMKEQIPQMVYYTTVHYALYIKDV